EDLIAEVSTTLAAMYSSFKGIKDMARNISTLQCGDPSYAFDPPDDDEGTVEDHQNVSESQKDWSYLKLSRAANQQFSDDPMLFTSLLEDANTILMAGSSIAIVIAALGIVAAYKNHRKLLYTYAILLVMSTMLHLGAGVLCCIFRDRFEKFALEYMDISLQTRYRGPFYTTQEFQGDRKFSLAVDYGQATLECCGVLNGSDYTKFTQWNRTWKHHDSDWKAKVPFTCCRPSSQYVLNEICVSDVSPLQNKLQNVSCPVEPTATNSYYYHGCFSHLEGIYKK
ncbi:hypothetical protein BaRGS_00019629, partial [Batillaria attramentaria]